MRRKHLTLLSQATEMAWKWRLLSGWEGSSHRPILIVTGVGNRLVVNNIDFGVRQLGFKSLHFQLLAVLLGQISEKLWASISSSIKQEQYAISTCMISFHL